MDLHHNRLHDHNIQQLDFSWVNYQISLKFTDATSLSFNILYILENISYPSNGVYNRSELSILHLFDSLWRKMSQSACDVTMDKRHNSISGHIKQAINNIIPSGIDSK